jgi:xylulokinase
VRDTGYLLGYDIGSSSVKASLFDIQDQRVIASATSPQAELDIISPKSGWAEQHPDMWWKHVALAASKLRT